MTLKTMVANSNKEMVFSTRSERQPRDATMNGLLEEVFSMRSVPSCYKQDDSHPSGGGFEYLHREPACRTRLRKGSLKSETLKYGHESQGTRTRKGLLWRVPAAYTKDRPVLSSERGPQKNKTVTVKV
jgi:hypothetical protein